MQPRSRLRTDVQGSITRGGFSRNARPARDGTLMGMGDAIERTIKKIGGAEEDDLLRRAFEQAAGANVCIHAHAVRNEGGKLLVCVDSPVVMQEILFKRLEIVQKVNEFLGKRAIISLRFRVFAGTGNGSSAPPDRANDF